MQQDVHTLPTIAKTTKTKPQPVTFFAADDWVVNQIWFCSGVMSAWKWPPDCSHVQGTTGWFVSDLWPPPAPSSSLPDRAKTKPM